MCRVWALPLRWGQWLCMDCEGWNGFVVQVGMGSWMLPESFSGKESQDDSEERVLEIHGLENLLWLLVCPKWTLKFIPNWNISFCNSFSQRGPPKSYRLHTNFIYKVGPATPSCWQMLWNPSVLLPTVPLSWCSKLVYLTFNVFLM